MGGNGLAATGQRANGRDIEISKYRHCYGARNGCSGEDHDVGVAALVAQGVALIDTKSVLFIDDDKTQIRKADALTEQRVGTHHNRGHPRGRS